MSTSTNYLLKGFFSLILSFAFIHLSMASNSVSVDSCDAAIVVEYDSLNNSAVLVIEHTGTPNSTIHWFDSSSADHVTVFESGEYCASVTTETGCIVSTCVIVQLSTTTSCQSYIVKESLSEGGFLLFVETENVDPNTSYQWSNGSAESSIHANESGDYCVSVTTGTGCYSEACIYVEVVPLPVDTCHTWIEKIPQEDGTVKLWAHSEGTGPFSYGWHNTTSDIPNGEEYIFVDESGDYCVIVYDANQCASEACVSVDVTTTPDSCFFEVQVFIIDAQTADGGVAIGVDPAGVGPFQTFWSNGSTGLDTHVQETGEYCVSVYDVNGCIGEGCIYVEVTPIPVDSCHTWLEQLPQEDGTVKIWAHTESVAPYSYAWNNDATSTVGEPYIYVDISGEYCVTVYDANQCTSEACIYVEISSPNDTCYIDPILHIIQDPATAQVRLGVDPTGVGPFTIYWPNGVAGDVFDVVESGEYCVTVVDANGCIGEACKYVEVDPVPTDSCYTWLEQLPQEDGTIKIWAHTEGVAPYSYAWNNDATSTVGEPYIYVDISGEYCVTVYDANQCTSEACIYVEVSSSNDTCYIDPILHIIQDPATAQVRLGVDPTGVGPFTIYWPNGVAGDVFDVVESGEYCVTVVDANGCIGEACKYVEVDPVPTDSCYTWLEQLPQDNGTVKLWAHTEGVAPYTYVWSNDASGTVGEPYFYVDVKGEYCITVFDANQCASEVCVYVEVDPVPTDSCYTWLEQLPQDNGTVKIYAHTEGVGPYTYEWNNNATGTVGEPYIYVDISGEYCVRVEDANGCIGEVCKYIEVNPVPGDTCYTWIETLPQDDGSIKVWAHTAGEGPFTYVWTNDAAGTVGEPFLYVRETGEYCVIVYDAYQCTSEACVYVEVDPVPNDSCEFEIVIFEADNTATGYVKLGVDPAGTAPFTYLWSDGSVNADFYAQEEGQYCVTVIDAKGCVGTACKYVEFPVDPPTDSCIVYLHSEIFAADYVVEVKAEATGVAPFEYIWSNGQTGSAIEVFEDQEVCVTVVDAVGCESKRCLDVDVPERPCSLEIIRTNNSTDEVVVLKAEVETNSDVEFNWSNGSTDDVIRVTTTGEYCVRIETSNGCVKEACVYVEIDNIICETIIEYGSNTTDYVAVLEANTAGVGPFIYSWSNGSDDSHIIVEESGEYCVKVEDARGCVSEDCIIVELAVPTCESRIYIVDESEEAVVLSVETDGHGPFEYFWSNGEHSKEIKVSESREYCVEVFDALGCLSWNCFYVEVENYQNCKVEIEVIANSDSSEYKVIAHPSGVAPFTYQWAHGETSRFFYPELDGYFCVTVTDAEGCVSETCFKTEGITPSVELEAFPSPTTGDFHIVIDSDLEFEGLVEIRDLNGHLLFTKNIDVALGIQALDFSSDEYPKGVFFVNIIRGSHVESIRVVKMGD